VSGVNIGKENVEEKRGMGRKYGPFLSYLVFLCVYWQGEEKEKG